VSCQLKEGASTKATRDRIATEHVQRLGKALRPVDVYTEDYGKRL
jgi:hypothetical protein